RDGVVVEPGEVVEPDDDVLPGRVGGDGHLALAGGGADELPGRLVLDALAGVEPAVLVRQDDVRLVRVDHGRHHGGLELLGPGDPAAAPGLAPAVGPAAGREG